MTIHRLLRAPPEGVHDDSQNSASAPGSCTAWEYLWEFHSSGVPLLWEFALLGVYLVNPAVKVFQNSKPLTWLHSTPCMYMHGFTLVYARPCHVRSCGHMASKLHEYMSRSCIVAFLLLLRICRCKRAPWQNSRQHFCTF